MDIAGAQTAKDRTPERCARARIYPPPLADSCAPVCSRINRSESGNPSAVAQCHGSTGFLRTAASFFSEALEGGRDLRSATNVKSDDLSYMLPARARR